jgi:hypothetical protein
MFELITLIITSIIILGSTAGLLIFLILLGKDLWLDFNTTEQVIIISVSAIVILTSIAFGMIAHDVVNDINLATSSLCTNN